MRPPHPRTQSLPRSTHAPMGRMHLWGAGRPCNRGASLHPQPTLPLPGCLPGQGGDQDPPGHRGWCLSATPEQARTPGISGNPPPSYLHLLLHVVMQQDLGVNQVVGGVEGHRVQRPPVDTAAECWPPSRLGENQPLDGRHKALAGRMGTGTHQRWAPNPGTHAQGPWAPSARGGAGRLSAS